MSRVSINKLGSVCFVFVQITLTVSIIHKHFIRGLMQPQLSFFFFSCQIYLRQQLVLQDIVFPVFSRKQRYIARVYFNAIVNL